MNPAQNYSSNLGKIKTGSTIHTDTKTFTDNGVMETVVTRTVTDHFSDGTTSTRQETQTTREEEVLNGGSGNLMSGVQKNYASPPPTPIAPPQQQQQQQQVMRMVGLPGQFTSHSSMPGEAQGALGFVENQNQNRDFGNDDLFIEEALRCHNKYRAKHNVPPLMVSKDLCKAAQSWADQLALLGTMTNSHYGYGENVYWSSGPGHAMKGDVPVEYWYHEEAHFDWQKMDFQKSTGSFTQLIWKDSKQFGIAKASGSKGTFVVAFYIPPGNVLSKFHENVFHPSTPIAR